MGTSESADAIWNDLSGLVTYSRQAMLRGFTINGYRTPYSMISDTIDDNEINDIIKLASVIELGKKNSSNIHLIPKTVFKPLDFILNIRRLKKLLTYKNKSNYWTSPRGKAIEGTNIFNESDNPEAENKSITIWANVRSPMEVKRVFAQIMQRS